MDNFNTTRGALHTGGMHWRALAPGEVTAAAGGCKSTDHGGLSIAAAYPAMVIQLTLRTRKVSFST